MRFLVLLSFVWCLVTFSSCRVHKSVTSDSNLWHAEKIFGHLELRDTLRLVMFSPAVLADSDSVCVATLIRHSVVSSQVEKADSFRSHSTSDISVAPRPVGFFHFPSAVSIVCCLALLCLLVLLWRCAHG